jgi:hypothetical protein
LAIALTGRPFERDISFDDDGFLLAVKKKSLEGELQSSRQLKTFPTLILVEQSCTVLEHTFLAITKLVSI